MEQQVIRVLGIAPYEGLKTLMEKEAGLYPQLQLDLYTGDLAAGAAIVQSIQPEFYDVIISRGGTAEMIRGITKVPVISVHVSVYDVLRTMKIAENYASKYAIVGFPPITRPAHILCDLLQSNVDIITIYDKSDVESSLQLLKDSGYRGVVCDMATHTCARELGMDAFLISSGAESIHDAFEMAISISTKYGSVRRENRFLRASAEESGSKIAVLSSSGALEYSFPTQPSEELLADFRGRLPKASTVRPLQFFVNQGSDLYQVAARKNFDGSSDSVMFLYSAYQIPSHTKNSGIISRSLEECRHLFQRSFFNISGSLGEIGQQLKQMAASQRPVMILGEFGTGKEQIARALYLYSNHRGVPLITIDCTLVSEKSWDFLFNHESSPINSRGATIYFKHLEALSVLRLQHLLSILVETNLTRRLRLLFSCDNTELNPLPENAASIIQRIDCLLLTMPALRTRSDEIPSLASLYLSSLNVELGKQLIGLDAQATRLFQQYRWPGNYVQFKNMLYELAATTEGSYIRSDDATRMLSRERSLHTAGMHTDMQVTGPQTLKQITLDAVSAVLEENDGNQSKTAKQLDISRSTLCRYLKQIEGTDSE